MDVLKFGFKYWKKNLPMAIFVQICSYIAIICDLMLPLLSEMFIDYVILDHENKSDNLFSFLLNGNFGQIHSMKLFLSIALVSMIVATISGVGVNANEFRFSMRDRESEIISSDFEKTINQLNISTTENAINMLVKERLLAIGIENAEISTEMDISDDSSIRISKVYIVCDSDDVNNCRAEVEKLGIDVLITERVNDEFYKDD